MKKLLSFVLVIFLLIAVYFLVWPVPVDPVAWKAPPNAGYHGPFARNELLKGIEFLKIGANHGPEDVALDNAGRIYVTSHEGFIVRLQPDGTRPENWVNTKGRPLGIDFDNSGNLIVADAFRGLLSISATGEIEELAKVADGVPVRYADDVDCAADGKIYFSDASTKFGAMDSGGTMEGSLLEIMEHKGNGRLLVYDPAARKAKTMLSGLVFANGVAVSHDQNYVLVNDTGNYRIIRYWIAGPRAGQSETIIENLPGFPDNISTGLDGRFWVALISPRNQLVDNLSDKPFLRKMVQRMPKFVRPRATAYGHIIAIDGRGRVVKDLQDPNTSYPQNTSVTETKDFLYIGSLISPVLARLSKSKLGL
ncbi:MAG: SMP-30/gluconolactonase/LRE family protein [Desulfobacteraceae bacterium]|nr:MAG: SMP-30/gluconolactonase/LRE family protein [Desulfobacteraceae bacterium]